jgi:putative hydrolase of the HAD superfamily
MNHTTEQHNLIAAAHPINEDKKPASITCALVDIGGVLLSNGWDRVARKRAADHFKLDFTELDERHHLNFEVYEIGKLTLEDYLQRVVFYEKRLFSAVQFKEFMFAQSTPIPEMIAVITELKHRYGLKVVALSNEGREINEHRIRHFQLTDIFDFFVSSCYVKLRKPDPDIFKLAFDMVQTPLQQIVFIDNTSLFTDIAKNMGMHTIHHQDYATTCSQLAAIGLELSTVNITT